MKFYQNLFEVQLKTKISILIISLLLEVSHLSSGQKFLPLSICNSYTSPQCHFPSTRCNKYLGLCECQQKFPIALLTVNLCLDYRSLGQECVVSLQCSQTENSICITSVDKQLDSVDKKLINEYLHRLKGHNNSLHTNSKHNTTFGYCKCKKGYKQAADNHCYRVSLDNLTCLGAYECLEADLNSHCDKNSKRCYCDPGYVYDNDKSECRIITKKFGDICKMDFECHNWDQNMECRNLVCICKTAYIFDYNTQRCKAYAYPLSPPTDSKYHLCKFGYRWDVQSGECEREWRYFRGQNDFISLDKFLETIVIVIFCCVTIAFLRFWRHILPQNIVSESQTGMFSDFSQTNRVQRRRTSRSNSLSRRGRVIQLRVNLDSPEPENLPNETFVTLPFTASHSSLPTYESASVTVSMIDSCPPPPYTDEPPTYEEAIKLFQTTKL